MTHKQQHCCCVCGTPVKYSRALAGKSPAEMDNMRELVIQFRDCGYCTTSIAIELNVKAFIVQGILDDLQR